ncbi:MULTISPECIES: (2Fe-2S)-binding protein [Zhongshania]|jgi:isoquinoline 1-oxidoreductase alpha subunit|uniref:(2Fe-2S)-binding protein n=2 Tax=Zhongshania TaxID=1434050 RepID=A0A127M2Y2_9GAMM|nr:MULTISPECIES: (2Fe-2S)-binding protein [Zhongshania]AMO67580.1 (2Fe-2S)-binding protein [Zhongshania aliphaticivorans]EIF45034.1 oxidoreductase [gamma proteobacterium BDW918]MBB5188596.1 isoquinoline 1-oxidoreductase alpha subunit [Zhongshania antarctica]|tara:strand:+ start:89046 stop:89504 length:459 start_codon:yes stop_codon:yes gene_type:complete
MLTIQVNGVSHTVDAPEDKPLLWVLRENLKLTGSKYGCGQALCGACTVHIDGQPTRACVMPVGAVGNKAVRTVEDIRNEHIGSLVQDAWRELNVPQCGYCQSGQIMAATALLKSNSAPSDQDIDRAMSGNICRCGTYPRIRKAIHKIASEQL